MPCLVVRDEAGGLRASFPLWGGRGFAISYRHSVTRQPCIERFRSGPGLRILLFSTEFQGSGAGLPFADEGGSVTIRDGMVVIDGMSRLFSTIHYAPLPLTEHRLVIGGRGYDLLGLVGGRGQAVVAIERCGPAGLAAAFEGRFR